ALGGYARLRHASRPAYLKAMQRHKLFVAALALIAGAALLFVIASWRGHARRARPGFVQSESRRFVIDSRPFRFVGANVSVMYRDTDPAKRLETLRKAGRPEFKVLGFWASEEAA